MNKKGIKNSKIFPNQFHSRLKRCFPLKRFRKILSVKIREKNKRIGTLRWFFEKNNSGKADRN
jgi:hypothetical protein